MLMPCSPPVVRLQYQVTPEQEQALITAFKSGPDALQASGIKVGDNKYMFLRPQGDSFYGKKGVSSRCHCPIQVCQCLP